MPLEIRNKIWSSLLGDRLIHLEFVGNLRHTVRQDDRPEDDMVEASTWTKTIGDQEIVWRQPHYHCEVELAYNPNRRRADPERDPKYMHLAVLRVCRQIYNEANHVLRTTNTFSLNDAGLSFYHFMEDRTTHQKRLLRRLRLQMDWIWVEEKIWDRPFSAKLIKSLTGLRILRLQINHQMDAMFQYVAKAWVNEFSCFEWGHLDLVRKIAMLPLSKVQVFVGDRC